MNHSSVVVIVTDCDAASPREPRAVRADAELREITGIAPASRPDQEKTGIAPASRPVGKPIDHGVNRPSYKRRDDRQGVASDGPRGMSFEKWGDLFVGIASSVKNM